MKICKTCGTSLPAAGVMICPECAEALGRLVAKRTDEWGFEYIEVGPVTCQECEYYGSVHHRFPCRDCRRAIGWCSRDYFKPKEDTK